MLSLAVRRQRCNINTVSKRLCSSSAIKTPPASTSWKINPGERVVLDDGKRTYCFTLQPNQTQNTAAGNIPHNEIMKAGYGARLIFPGVSKKRSYIVRRQSFDIFVKKLKRQCTPSYPKDFGAIGNLLDLRSNIRVLEAGTGTGMLSLYIESRIGPNGELWSFEIREDFHHEAVKNVKKWNPNSQIKFFLGDVTTIQVPDEYFDALLLDMMTPWTVIESLLPKLKPAANIVCVQPNISQILEFSRVVKEKQLPVVPIRTLEVMEREWCIDGLKSHPIMAGQAGDVSMAHTCFLHHCIKGGFDYELPVVPKKEIAKQEGNSADKHKD